ncbi:MAG: hypothetical protein WC714_29065 [Candidatus Obscuribacterales bacterium]|jgi:hypothetical protein
MNDEQAKSMSFEVIEPATNARPSLQQLVAGVAEFFGVNEGVALEWLRDEFDPKVYAGQEREAVS